MSAPKFISSNIGLKETFFDLESEANELEKKVGRGVSVVE